MSISSNTPTTPTPWMTSKEAAAYMKRGRRFVLDEIKKGRMRGAVVGGRQEILTRSEWVDEWIEKHAEPVAVPLRRRVG